MFPTCFIWEKCGNVKKKTKGMNFTILRYNDPDPTDPTFQTPYFLVGCATGPRLMKGGPRVFPVWKVWMLSEVIINQWLLRFCGILWIFKEGCSCYLVFTMLARNSLEDKVLADDLSLSQCISRIDLFWKFHLGNQNLLCLRFGVMFEQHTFFLPPLPTW